MTTLFTGCVSYRPAELYHVGSYNIRISGPNSDIADRNNNWESRKEKFVEQVRDLNLDVFGLQEVTPVQAQYLREQLPEFEFVGEHRGADRKSSEASPVAFRKSRFTAEKSGTFWLSETPDVPGVKGWGAACPRVCSYLILRNNVTGKRFCFANTHTDHVSALARKNGILLIIERMKEFGEGLPIVFTGDHNCRPDSEPAKAAREILSDARMITKVKDPGPDNSYNGFGKIKDTWSGTTGAEGEPSPDHRIDYIYVTPGTHVLDFVTHNEKRGEKLYYSDHYPVTATIAF